MFQRMKTRKGVAISDQAVMRVHEIRLLKYDSRYFRGNRPHIKHFDIAEARDMGDEPVNSGPYIHMSLWLGIKDHSRNQ